MKNNKYATKRNVMVSILAFLISFIHIHAQECDTLIQIKSPIKTSLIDMRPSAFSSTISIEISNYGLKKSLEDIGMVEDTLGSVLLIDTTTLHYDTFAPELQAEWNEFIEICNESALDDIQLGALKNWVKALLTEIIFRTYEKGNHGITWIIPISDGTVNGKKVAAITDHVYNHVDYSEMREKILNGEWTRENISSFNLSKLYDRLAVTYYNFGERHDNLVAQGKAKSEIDSIWGQTFLHEQGNAVFGLQDSPNFNKDIMDPKAGWGSLKWFQENNNGNLFTAQHRSQLNTFFLEMNFIEQQVETTIENTTDFDALNTLELKLDTLFSNETVKLLSQDLQLYTYTDCANEQVNANPTLELDIPSPHTVAKVGDNYEITAGAISGIETVAMTIKTTMDSSTDSDNPNRITRDTTINIVIVGSTSVDEQSSDNLKIYPNPTSYYLTIEGDTYNRYQLISTQGIMLQSGKLTNKTNIDLSKFSTGIYIIALQDRTTGKYIHCKVVKR